MEQVLKELKDHLDFSIGRNQDFERDGIQLMTINCKQKEQYYSDLYFEYVCLIQRHAEHTNTTHLVFASMAVNMIMMASELNINVKFGRRTLLVPGSFSFDEQLLRRYNKKNGTHHRALPWIWQRYGQYDSHPNPWTIWFEDLCINPSDGIQPVARLRELERELSLLRPELPGPHLLELGMCMAYVSRFNQDCLARVSRQGRVATQRTVAVHIGIPEMEQGFPKKEKSQKTPVFLKPYIKEMEKFLLAGHREFYLICQSQDAIDYLIDYFGNRCHVTYQQVDRSRYPKMEAEDVERKYSIEYWCLDDPNLTGYLVETTLSDLNYAGQCLAMIGSLESDFSKLAFLFMVGQQRQTVQFSNISGGEIAEGLVHPNIKEGSGRSLLVIKERDVGFFSLFLQIVNTLLFLEEINLNALPIVCFSDKQQYSTGGETWEKVFEPLVFLNPNFIQELVEKANQGFEARKDDMALWDEFGLVYQLSGKVFWSGSYYPRLLIHQNGFRFHRWLIRQARKTMRKMVPRIPWMMAIRDTVAPHFPKEKFLIDHNVLPTRNERLKASLIIGKFFSLKPKLRVKLEKFFAGHRDHYVIGVYFRGTDARVDRRRSTPEYETYIEVISGHLASLDREKREKVFLFVASDESAFLDFIAKQFDSVGYFESIRHEDRRWDPKGQGIMGWSVPSFIQHDPESALEGAVLDYAGLCKSHFLIHNFGSLPNAVLLTCPDLQHLLIGEDIKQSQ